MSIPDFFSNLLKDKHRDTACNACHTDNLYKEKTPLTCDGCHKTDDVHRGKNGPKCANCHDQKGWRKTQFDHDRKTKFPLKGGHADVGCESCHKGDVYKVKLEKSCYSCHRGDDRHLGNLGKECESCHSQVKWGEKVRFDHDITKFPLIGLHMAAPCEACHLTASYKKTSKECIQCHRQDDEHKRTLGNGCAVCHNPNDWTLWQFDHDAQSDFRLTGKHNGLKCELCHYEPVDKEVRQSSACDSCHRKDDIHLGRFGRQCERCHSDESFKEVDLRRKPAQTGN